MRINTYCDTCGKSLDSFEYPPDVNCREICIEPCRFCLAELENLTKMLESEINIMATQNIQLTAQRDSAREFIEDYLA